MKVFVFQAVQRSLDIPGDPPLHVENYILSTSDEKVAERARRQSSLVEITEFEVKPESEDKPKTSKPKKNIPPPVTVVQGMRTVKEKE